MADSLGLGRPVESRGALVLCRLWLDKPWAMAAWRRPLDLTCDVSSLIVRNCILAPEVEPYTACLLASCVGAWTIYDLDSWV
jgi:hypothetical protein